MPGQHFKHDNICTSQNSYLPQALINIHDSNLVIPITADHLYLLLTKTMSLFLLILSFLIQITEYSIQSTKKWNTLSSAGLTFFGRLCAVACFLPV